MTTQPKSTARLHFAATTGKPKCGRQLTAKLRQNARNSESMALTQDPAAVRCRHCLRAMGLLAPVARVTPEDRDEIEELYNELTSDDEGEDEV